MPRNVRNFWIELSVDGSKSRVETGPRNKDGGFELTILQRDGGGITHVLNVSGEADSDGKLRLHVIIPREAETHRVMTDVDPGDILIRTER